MFQKFVILAKEVSFSLGAIMTVCAAYVAVGLPVPMTEAAVKAKVEPIIQTLETLHSTQGLILGDLSTVQRSVLRNEKFTLERSLDGANMTIKAAVGTRIAQIQDELKRIDRRDAANALQR